ncbi:Endonuclease/exonuclease/phosphatase [Ephemerocybe angulata]|uniref:Endonuclease/exonuclease/phosphatase n=1 Tax=Ephemerocybe angulata TaxID=980116 RepID=A0A8H6M2Q9_9AGAR|nr:Endonuclease/exonuclease/phosphatase [Tulosesus angulatus]
MVLSNIPRTHDSDSRYHVLRITDNGDPGILGAEATYASGDPVEETRDNGWQERGGDEATPRNEAEPPPNSRMQVNEASSSHTGREAEHDRTPADTQTSHDNGMRTIRLPENWDDPEIWGTFEPMTGLEDILNEIQPNIVENQNGGDAREGHTNRRQRPTEEWDFLELLQTPIDSEQPDRNTESTENPQPDVPQAPGPATRKDRTNTKNSRAALRIASLNIRGAGSSRTRSKWTDIARLMKTRSINVLAVQETHLTEDQLSTLNHRHQGVRIISSPNPDNPSSKGGVAIILNRHNTCWQEVEVEYTRPGRALTVEVRWGHTSKLRITAVYAPSGDPTANAELWSSLHNEWETNPHKRPDVILGDFNMVEHGLDRPARQERTPKQMKTGCGLVDGWQRNHADGKPEYTFKTKKRNCVNSRSRIDRIYLKESLYKLSYEWRIEDSGLHNLDHYMVTAYIATKDTPYVGKGRSTIGDFILEFKEVQEAFVKRTKALEKEIETLLSGETERTSTTNPQTIWKAYKDDLLTIARDFSRKRISRIDKEIEMWEKRKKAILALDNLQENDDEQILLDEVEDNITDLLVAKTLRQRTKMDARHHLIGETNSKYDYILHKEKKPRDTIPRLRKPGLEPAQYSTSTNEMLDIATTHHETLQEKYEHTLSPSARGKAREKALKNVPEWDGKFGQEKSERQQ